MVLYGVQYYDTHPTPVYCLVQYHIYSNYSQCSTIYSLIISCGLFVKLGLCNVALVQYLMYNVHVHVCISHLDNIQGFIQGGMRGIQPINHRPFRRVLPPFENQFANRHSTIPLYIASLTNEGLTFYAIFSYQRLLLQMVLETVKKIQ